MERDHRRIKTFYKGLVALIAIILFFIADNLNGTEFSENMDKEISVKRETRESFAAPIPALSLSKMRLFTGGRHLFRRGCLRPPFWSQRWFGRPPIEPTSWSLHRRRRRCADFPEQPLVQAA